MNILPQIKDGPLAAYLALRDRNEIQEDPLQTAAAEKLQRLHQSLKNYQPDTEVGGFLSRFGLGSRKPTAPPRGLYIFGPAGRGKSMLMDFMSY